MYSYKEFVNQKCEDISLNQNQHIYITSNEEIKEGDWVITYNGLLAKVITEFEWHFKNSKKIILTTDQDLIKDGVQAIDDDFLEWFVKNPSCEEVETVKGLMKLNDDGQEYGFPDMSKYKIIIPQEEHPKQIKCYCGHTTYCDCSPLEEHKQETLEEAAESYGKDIGNKDGTAQFDFIRGAKWQAERMGLMEIELRHTKTLLASCEKALEDRDKQAEKMYSEEEVLELLKKSHFVEQNIEDWFEQFKKK
jgi:hypothetical protein